MSISANILRMGIELEGGWCREHLDGDARLRDAMKEDSSVDFFGDGLESGEMALGPWSCVTSMKNALRLHWPDETNGSCGMHIHMELSPLAWYALVPSENQTRFLDEAVAWCNDNTGRYPELTDAVPRLLGNNDFCRRNEFATGRALFGGGEDRYSAFNALPYWYQRTLEFRAWPQFERCGTGLFTVDFMIAHVESFVKALRGREAELLHRIEEAEETIDEAEARVEPIPSHMATVMEQKHRLVMAGEEACTSAGGFPSCGFIGCEDCPTVEEVTNATPPSSTRPAEHWELPLAPSLPPRNESRTMTTAETLVENSWSSYRDSLLERAGGALPFSSFLDDYVDSSD